VNIRLTGGRVDFHLFAVVNRAWIGSGLSYSVGKNSVRLTAKRH
jgi:hypothetical protein